ncbi:hypothetical protein BIZ37_27960 [Photobacterium sp. BZF1]|uniref:hypothetical protein n=1 Tax=Photobacterium sp. BZF1 TaxID=1904457 RepID=UPI001653691F|nr:hypothetical protein [Photobacterium sp. BZF1]MBC7006396.1 hypothetical protein [Photobacterium sp. BZF1]
MKKLMTILTCGSVLMGCNFELTISGGNEKFCHFIEVDSDQHDYFWEARYVNSNHNELKLDKEYCENSVTMFHNNTAPTATFEGKVPTSLSYTYRQVVSSIYADEHIGIYQVFGQQAHIARDHHSSGLIFAINDDGEDGEFESIHAYQRDGRFRYSEYAKKATELTDIFRSVAR